MWVRSGSVTSAFALLFLSACTLLKPSDAELRGEGGKSGGSGGNGGIGTGGTFASGGAQPKCQASGNWETTDLGSPSDISSPLLIARTDDWVVAWIDGGNVRLRSVSKDLMPLGPEDVASPGNASELRVAFNSNSSSQKLGFVWFDTTLEFASVALDGTVNAHPVYGADPQEPVGKGPRLAAIAARSSGPGWGIVWQGYGDSASRLYALVTDDDGANQTQVGSDNYTRLTDGTCFDKTHPALITRDQGLALAYSDNSNGIVPDTSDVCPAPGGGKPDIQFATSDDSLGSAAASLVAKGDGTADFPALAWNGTEYGVAWIDDRNVGPRVWFSLEPQTKTAIPISDAEPSANKAPSVAAGEKGFGVAWQEGAVVHFAEIEGGYLRYDAKIATDAAPGQTPSVIWAGDKWLIAWAKSTAQLSTCTP